MPKLTALSGFDAKGPACFLLEIDDRRLMLDLGEGPDHAVRPDLRGVDCVDAILVSHAHTDHTGALDLAYRLGSPPVYATRPAMAFAPALADAHVLPRQGTTTVAGITVETGPAGHAPGAIWMRLGGKSGLLYTGDRNAEGTLFACSDLPQATALVFDASYGAADVSLDEQRINLLALAEERPLILPAPAGGRGLELALAFFAAGFTVAICPAHRRAAEYLLGFPDWLQPGRAGALSDLLAATKILQADTPISGVAIAASPNADRGLAAELVKREDAQIVFTGHLGQGTPAARLVAEGRAVFMRWNVHPRLSEQTAILSAVAPRVALPAFVGAEGRTALARALPGVPLATERLLAW
jgi:glyoxylase-like metal-dependent hydrolase (beta-lactamase superfamily II)